MSINGMMRTSISGMEAQSSRLGAVSANIANASTVGYKSAETQFTSMLIDTPNGSFNAGGVEADTHYSISRQGVLSGTSSKFDLGISGSGFFVVQDGSGKMALTRAGAFVPDGDGNLVNAAGFKLMGLPAAGDSKPSLVANGTAGLVPVKVSHTKLEAAATSSADLMVNVPSGGATIAAPDLPSANASTSTSTAHTSVVAYGNLGEEVTVDVHYAKTSTPGVWEVSVFDAAARSAAGGFPYSSGPLAQTTLTFDVAGQLSSSSAMSLTVPVPGGTSMDLNLAGTSQLATDFSVRSVNANGNPPNDNSVLEIGKDGILAETYSNGKRAPTWLIPLATVISPDRMLPLSGNVFEPSSTSGDLRLGGAGAGGFGSINAGSLEGSTVDLSAELTDMIEAQRNYTANSKVFQTGSELMDVLVNLKR